MESDRLGQIRFLAREILSMEEIIAAFANSVRDGDIELYNEFSLQHELGIYLRGHLPAKKIQFERNVAFFGMKKADFVKREIDISIFDSSEQGLEAAIELKYPRNGQYPEQMFSFCKDVSFTEQLLRAGCKKAYVVIFAEDRLFYEGNQTGIYTYFRGGNDLAGTIQKPTGRQETELQIQGRYSIEWRPVRNTLKYTVIKAQ